MQSSDDPRPRTGRLAVEQTATGYWVVTRKGVHLRGAMTRRAAEAERDMLGRLGERSLRRGQKPGPGTRS